MEVEVRQIWKAQYQGSRLASGKELRNKKEQIPTVLVISDHQGLASNLYNEFCSHLDRLININRDAALHLCSIGTCVYLHVGNDNARERCIAKVLFCSQWTTLDYTLEHDSPGSMYLMVIIFFLNILA